jgi:hypothetical protein
MDIPADAYLAAAAIGGTLLACQTLLAAAGFGGHHDADAHPGDPAGDSSVSHGQTGHAPSTATAWLAGLLTLRSVSAGLTLFGLVGLAGASGGWGWPATPGAALGAGLGGMALTAGLMLALRAMESSGTLPEESAVGARGSVILTVPADRRGAGKVQLTVAGRLLDLPAVTASAVDLPTGTEVVVSALSDADRQTVVVAPAPKTVAS